MEKEKVRVGERVRGCKGEEERVGEKEVVRRGECLRESKLLGVCVTDTRDREGETERQCARMPTREWRERNRAREGERKEREGREGGERVEREETSER